MPLGDVETGGFANVVVVVICPVANNFVLFDVVVEPSAFLVTVVVVTVVLDGFVTTVVKFPVAPLNTYVVATPLASTAVKLPGRVVVVVCCEPPGSTIIGGDIPEVELTG